MFENQPKGLWALALANTGERFGYYTMLAVFLLYLQANFGFETGLASTIYSTFLMMVYFLPIIGGIAAGQQHHQGLLVGQQLRDFAHIGIPTGCLRTHGVEDQVGVLDVLARQVTIGTVDRMQAGGIYPGQARQAEPLNRAGGFGGANAKLQTLFGLLVLVTALHRRLLGGEIHRRHRRQRLHLCRRLAVPPGHVVAQRTLAGLDLAVDEHQQRIVEPFAKGRALDARVDLPTPHLKLIR